MKMVTPIDKTAGISKESEVLPLDLSSIRQEYESYLSDIKGMVRVNLPNIYSTIIGSRYNDFILVHYDEHLKLSMQPLHDKFEKKTLYYYNPNRHPKKSILNTDDDNQFFICSSDYLQEGDKIKFDMIEQTETTERYIVIEKL